MTDSAALPCLHCAISEMLMLRQRCGETPNADLLFKLCEVIGDVACAIDARDRTLFFETARLCIDTFEGEINAGIYKSDQRVRGENPFRFVPKRLG